MRPETGWRAARENPRWQPGPNPCYRPRQLPCRPPEKGPHTLQRVTAVPKGEGSGTYSPRRGGMPLSQGTDEVPGGGAERLLAGARNSCCCSGYLATCKVRLQEKHKYNREKETDQWPVSIFFNDVGPGTGAGTTADRSALTLCAIFASLVQPDRRACAILPGMALRNCTGRDTQEGRP